MEAFDNAYLMWGVFITLVPVLLIADLFIFNRKDHAIGLQESLKMSGYYIAIGLLFGVFVYWNMGENHALDYYTAFVLEKSLSLDNLFVISVIFTAFSIPKEYQHRVLVWGIIGVIVLRGIMIGLGTAIVHEFEWVLLIFAAFLVFTGIKMLMMKDHDENESFEDKKMVKFLRKHLNFTPDFYGHKFWVKLPSKKDASKTALFATPLFLALVIVELTDVMFAFDSIPAVLAVTTNTYIVYTSNIFAILGLRALFFAVESLMNRFSLMQYALSIVLIFIGAKVFLNESGIFHVSPAISLSTTLFVLLGGMIFSVLITGNNEKKNPD